MSAIQVMLIGALGSALQELLHWYGLREHLSTPRYKQLIRSVPYWAITVLMIVGSGVAVWAWFAGETDLPARQYLVLGAALPLILKKAVEAATGSKPATTVARGPGAGSKLGDYFRSSGVGEERLA